MKLYYKYRRACTFISLAYVTQVCVLFILKCKFYKELYIFTFNLHTNLQNMGHKLHYKNINILQKTSPYKHTHYKIIHYEN